MHLEGSWGGFYMFAAAFPFSIISLAISRAFGGIYAFVILNTLWWFFLPLTVVRLYKKTRSS